MANENQPFSAMRRPRETLGGMSSSNFNSAIPQPASALKKATSHANFNMGSTAGPTPFIVSHGRSLSSSRASLAPNGFGRPPQQPDFQRVSSGSNLANMGSARVSHRMSTVNHSASRQSMMPGGVLRQSIAQQTPGTQQRRSSTYSRPPSMGVSMNMRQTFYPTAPLSTSAPKDPRPLKERSFQAKLGQELLDYLTTNGFQMDTDHPLTQKSMTSPTQKDFNLVFQWLYKRIDPGYRFQKAIDAEVPPILKLLRYPFQASITKSQIAAVGGQNWSTFLGLLHWMMQLGITMDRYASGEFDALCLESGQDVTGELIVFDFLSASYGNWMTLDPEDEDPDRHLKPHIEAMAAAFDAANGKLAEELKIMEGENAALQAQLEELEAAVPDLAKLDEINRLLHEDAAMFEDYILSHGARAEKYEHRLRDLEERLAARDADLAAAEAERQALQAAVDEQGISIQDIDRMNAERERLLKGAEATAQRLEESQARLAEREADAHARLENLERALETYAGLGYTVGIIPAGAPNAQGQDLSLDLAGPDPKAVADLDPAASVAVNAFSASTARLDASDARLLQQPLNGAHTPSSILTRAPRTSIRPALTALQHTLSTRRQTASEAMLRDLDLLETLKETVEEKRAEVEAVEHRVRAAEEEFEKTKQVESCAGMSSRAEMERMEKELGRMRVGVGEGWRVMEQREAVVNVEYEQLVLRAESLREELHTDVERMLNDVIKFKVHIQKSLEDYEGFVVEEVEEELGREPDVEVQGVGDQMRDLGLTY